MYALGAHAMVQDPSQGERIIEQARGILNIRFQIGHMTLQLEQKTLPIEQVVMDRK